MISPILTFNSDIAPFSALSSLAYYQNAPDGDVIPVNVLESSTIEAFRIFNNLALSSNVASADNVELTTYDGVSLTAATFPVSQMWIHMYEKMFGESLAGSYYSYTAYTDVDTPVGGSSVYAPLFTSAGVVEGSGDPPNNSIRAGSNGNGWGFISFYTYASVPAGATAGTYVFVISCLYDYAS